jgi:hypothetical protein
VNPLPPIAHLLAIAVGVFGGLALMGRIAPDLPDPAVKPAVGAPSTPSTVKGGDPNSLFRAQNLSGALDQLQEQLGAGDTVYRLLIKPGTLHASTSSPGLSLDIDAVDPTAPQRIAAAINAQRPDLHGLDEFGSMILLARDQGSPTWQALLLPEVGTPRLYTAKADGSGVKAR